MNTHRDADANRRPSPVSPLWATILLLTLVTAASRVEAGGTDEPRFHRGDATADGNFDLSDGVFILQFLFNGGDDPPCKSAADADDNGVLQISDPVYLFSWLFLGGPQPPPPFFECGVDPTPDTLGCLDFPMLPGCEVIDDSEFQALVASYDIIETIAGRGFFPGRDVGWDDDFEGGPAIEAELTRPHSTMGDEAGNYYIADKDAHAIRKVLPDGSIVTVAGTNVAGDDGDEPGPGVERRLNEPNGLWVHGDGRVYILDTANGKVRKLDTAGELTTLFTVPAELGGIVVGRGLWVSDAEDLVYVSSFTQVLRWTPSSGVEVFSTGYGQLGNLDVDPNGNLVVTDRGEHRVYRVDSEGERTPIAGNGFGGRGVSGTRALDVSLEEVRGIFFRDDGSYFLGLHEASQIWFVDTNGIAWLFVDGREDAHGGDGQPFQDPSVAVSEVRNVTVDPAGNVIITEHDAGYVRRVRRL